MTIAMGRPGVDELSEVVSVLRTWQYEGAPFQLHPGDLGWFHQLGAEATAAAVRTWSRDGRLLAIGLLDGPELLRLATAPDALQDEALARRIAEDATDPERGVLPEGEAAVEAPIDASVRQALLAHGWNDGEPWTHLRRDLADPVADPGVRIEVIGPERAHVRTAVHRAAFDGSKFTDERWHATAAGPPYADARCLVAFDDTGEAVAAATAWSAGPGRPGILEPVGVPQAHRGHGYGTAIILAAAAALRALGSSSAVVGTPSANAGAVAAYESAGFQRFSESGDVCRAAGAPS